MAKPHTLVAAAIGCMGFWIGANQLSGCGDEDAECQEGSRTFPVGARWTCSDGCNYCECTESDGMVGVISSLLLCDEPPGPAANKLLCTDEGGVYRHGDTWACDEGVTCSCNDGKVERKPG